MSNNVLNPFYLPDGVFNYIQHIMHNLQDKLIFLLSLTDFVDLLQHKNVRDIKMLFTKRCELEDIQDMHA